MKGDTELVEDLKNSLEEFSRSNYPLPGIKSEANCIALCKQIVSSIHRIKFIQRIRERKISPATVDPSSESFDPLKAAIFHFRNGNIEEAFWLIFLSVHFGKHGKSGWQLVRAIYGANGAKKHWNWKNISSNSNNFRKWLAKNQDAIKSGKNPGRFGNHRKYESLDAWSNAGTGHVIETYVNWIKEFGSHQKLIENAKKQVGDNPGKLFDYLYRSMSSVHRFGRTARFDYLTMVGKIGLAQIEPRSTYMQGATGPFQGAKLLFGKVDLSRKDLDRRVVELGDHLDVNMQIMEDALCNWQKKPNAFVLFRG